MSRWGARFEWYSPGSDKATVGPQTFRRKTACKSEPLPEFNFSRAHKREWPAGIQFPQKRPKLNAHCSWDTVLTVVPSNAKMEVPSMPDTRKDTGSQRTKSLALGSCKSSKRIKITTTLAIHIWMITNLHFSSFFIIFLQQESFGTSPENKFATILAQNGNF